jgi:hypothetical protein
MLSALRKINRSNLVWTLLMLPFVAIARFELRLRDPIWWVKRFAISRPIDGQTEPRLSRLSSSLRYGSECAAWFIPGASCIVQTLALTRALTIVGVQHEIKIGASSVAFPVMHAWVYIAELDNIARSDGYIAFQDSGSGS